MDENQKTLKRPGLATLLSLLSIAIAIQTIISSLHSHASHPPIFIPGYHETHSHMVLHQLSGLAEGITLLFAGIYLWKMRSFAVGFFVSHLLIEVMVGIYFGFVNPDAEMDAIKHHHSRLVVSAPFLWSIVTGVNLCCCMYAWWITSKPRSESNS